MGIARPRNRASVATTLLALGLILLPLGAPRTAEGPILWGYGVKGCRDFLNVARRRSETASSCATGSGSPDW